MINGLLSFRLPGGSEKQHENELLKLNARNLIILPYGNELQLHHVLFTQCDRFSVNIRTPAAFVTFC
jgi:hypothetical protein